MVDSNDPKSMVLLESTQRKACAKHIKLDKNQKIHVTPYGKEVIWNASVVRAENIRELGRIVQRQSQAAYSIAIPGALGDESNRESIWRRMKGATAELKTCARQWVCIDVDDVRVTGYDTPAKRLIKLRDTMLPVYFRSVKCVYQLSSQYMIKGDENDLRAHLWFMLDAPVELSVLYQHFKEEKLVDASVFIPVQPIYTASPVFTGIDDPVERRIGMLAGSADEVCVEDMELEESVRRAAALAATGNIITNEIEPCESQIEAQVARIRRSHTEGSRHHHAFGVVCELFALGADAALIEEVTTEVIQRQGRDPQPNEVRNMIRSAKEKHENGTLRSDVVPYSQLFDEAEAEDMDREVREAGDDTDGMFTEDELAAIMTEHNSDYANAMIYLDQNHKKDGGYMRWLERDMEFVGNRWREMGKETLKSRVQRTAGSSLSNSQCRNVTNTVRDISLEEDLEMPSWLGPSLCDPHLVVPCKNGLLLLADWIYDPSSTDALIPHTKDFFSTACLPYAYDPEAACPNWEAFLGEVFEGDPESVRELQKMFGYFLTASNRYEKIFIFKGLPRGGKGTIVTVLQELVGISNIASPSLQGLGKDFGFGNMLGKTVCLVNEANADKQSDVPQLAIDRLKAVSGNDRVEVEKKHKDPVYRHLFMRFLLSCNNVPRFRDPSGALNHRLIVFEFVKSWAGREDSGLKTRLLGEMPGILNWALTGLYNLEVVDQAFRQPTSSADLVADLLRSNAPTASFADDCLEVTGRQADKVSKDGMYGLYRAWCEDEGMRLIPVKSILGKELKALFPRELGTAKSTGGKRGRAWCGVKLTPFGEELAQSSTEAAFGEEGLEGY